MQLPTAEKSGYFRLVEEQVHQSIYQSINQAISGLLRIIQTTLLSANQEREERNAKKNTVASYVPGFSARVTIIA